MWGPQTKCRSERGMLGFLARDNFAFSSVKQARCDHGEAETDMFLTGSAAGRTETLTC